MSEKIRVVVDLCTPTRERRPETVDDVYDDFKVLEFNSKEELANELAEMAGYDDLEEFKQELADEGDDLDDYNLKGDELDKICQYLLGYMDDPGDGSPNIQYISINGKPAYEDCYLTYDSLLDNMDLLAHGSEEDIIEYVLEHDDYIQDDDEDEDDDEEEDDDESENSLNIKPEDFYLLFKGDKNLYARAAKILYHEYKEEGRFEDFDSKEEFLDFVRKDIYEMLDAADSESDVITVKKAMGIYDPEEYEDSEDLEESFKSKDKYPSNINKYPSHILNGLLDYIDAHGNNSEFSYIRDGLQSALDSIDSHKMEEGFKSKEKYSVLREALDRLDKTYSKKTLKESTVYNYIVRYDGWVEPLYITSVNPFDLGKKKDAYKFNSFDDAFNAWEELCKDPKFKDSITNKTDRTIFKIKA